MKVLVTGAGGFIGAHVVAELLTQSNWSVVALDRYEHHTVTMENYDSRACVVSYDLHEPLEFDAFPGVNAVINLASSSDMSTFLEDPAWHTLNNVTSTLNLLEWARHRKLRSFIQVSTNEVYGPNSLTAITKEWDTLRPQTPYSASKAAQEMLAIGWHKTYGVSTQIVNTAHVYGPGQPSQRFIPTAISKILDGEKVPLLNDAFGAQRRNWTYVGDLAAALVWMIQNDDLVRTLDRWNVVGPERSCLEITRMLGTILQRDFSVDWIDGPLRPGYDYRYALDGSKLASAGFQQFGLRYGLGKTVKWILDERAKVEET